MDLTIDSTMIGVSTSFTRLDDAAEATERVSLKFTAMVDGAKVITMQFKTSAPIYSVKAALSAKLNHISPASISLIFASKVLLDFVSLAQCKVYDGASVQVVVSAVTSRLSAALAPSANIADIFKGKGGKSVVISVVNAGAAADAVPMHTAPSSTKIKKMVRAKAKKLLKKGIAGLLVIPGPTPETNRVVMLDAAMLAKVKEARAAVRARSGRPYLPEGTDAGMICAMNGVLGEVDEEKKILEEISEEISEELPTLTQTLAQPLTQPLAQTDKPTGPTKMQELMAAMRVTKMDRTKAIARATTR